MRRAVLAGVAALLLTTTLGSPALADFRWCLTDPIVIVDGHVVQVETRFLFEHLPSVEVVRYDIEVPAASRVRVVELPSPAPERVHLTRSNSGDYRVVVRATVKADTTFETFTTVTKPSGEAVTVSAESNQTVKVVVQLGR